MIMIVNMCISIITSDRFYEYSNNIQASTTNNNNDHYITGMIVTAMLIQMMRTRKLKKEEQYKIKKGKIDIQSS